MAFFLVLVVFNQQGYITLGTVTQLFERQSYQIQQHTFRRGSHHPLETSVDLLIVLLPTVAKAGRMFGR